MAGPEDRMREETQKERVMADRQRSELQKQERSLRVRHDAVGVASRILDSRIVKSEVVMPEIAGFIEVAGKGGGALSQYEVGPIRDALLIRALGGKVEREQAKLVAVRDNVIDIMLQDPQLQSALRKEADYDYDIGDRPEEMTADEWDRFGKYQEVKMERQAIVDAMTNGVAGMYDDKEDIQRRLRRLEMRQISLEAKAGNLSPEERKEYQGLLAKMFGELKGPEANNYSRWAGQELEDLTSEEKVMLAEIWKKMEGALDGGEEAELDRLEERNIRPLQPSEQKLYDRRLKQIRDVAAKEPDELAELDRLIKIPYYRQNEDERNDLEARVSLLAEEAKISNAEIGMFWRLKERTESGGRLAELRKKKTDGDLTKGERARFSELRERAGTLTEAETESVGKIEKLRETLQEQIDVLDEKINEKVRTLGESSEWMQLADTFAGMVQNINVTDQWMRAWHDLSAGAVDSFTQTRWAEYQETSKMIALMKNPQIGRAFQEAFRALCIVGLNKTGVPGAINVMQREKVTQEQLENGLVKPVREFVKNQLNALNSPVGDLYVDVGVDMARMFFENSFCSAWLCAKRDDNGNIIYTWNGNDSSDTSSEAYKYAVPVAWGDGVVWDVGRQNDYVKPATTRAKQMKEFSPGYETGLPAMLPVLPDNLAKPWISHEDMVAIANGQKNLIDTFIDRPENSRWGWAYGMFRAAQVYDMVSKFAVGLKGFRGAAGEVWFFLKSASNLGGLAKKIDVAFGDDLEENQRFRMNFAMALLYAVDTGRANPSWPDEMKTILANRREGGLEEEFVSWLIKGTKDDIGRMFVGRAGFVTQKQWDYIWTTRYKQVDPGKGNRGLGMIKKGEQIGVYFDKAEKEEWKKKRRESLVNQV